MDSTVREKRSPQNKLIALDCDGVLLNYHEAYQRFWAIAFGERPRVRNPRAYWARDRFEVPTLDAQGQAHFRAIRGEAFWSTMQPIGGAIAACNQLVAAGYRLICVSALEPRYRDARLGNLIACGFPIEEVIATPDDGSGDSPKAIALAKLSPAAFVDDFAPYLRGLPTSIHRALVLREPDGSPNVAELLMLADSTHANLAGFADAWCARCLNEQPHPGAASNLSSRGARSWMLS